MSTSTITTTFGVDGMTCGHCVAAVTSELSALPGVKDVTVQLVVGGSSTVSVISDSPLPDEQISAAVAEAGYAITPRRSLL
ncbi:heavy-metal-associated domain-containing protein [Cellulomonas fengjieae]|uniref:Heavy-metal-associated domain-containing protein n=1 Tax=Cellulomonas fengjieae TaxID=2819978 RepID=A0ABS3SK48_9CELL|nr:heavy-metal-associated domain-containing protein [Cellulomonas fengjieae]MBO3086113.1 heavy-metal-associated domain-containing protein [Cellulomonas fengjieae]MBO3102483.1 heavy-metal-associated domain-containing protein [Cellulomonas fengjieae]QVI65825.1 heavy-metal-associated domain-containing protein [Cellulomonas fengjieae]